MKTIVKIRLLYHMTETTVFERPGFVRSGVLPLLASSISESSLDTRRPAETDSKNLGCRGSPCRAFLGLPRNN